jgi:hypothetical protein
MRVSERMFLTARFARDAKGAEGRYIFFSAERAEKKKNQALEMRKTTAGHLRPYIRVKLSYCYTTCDYCFPSSQRKTIKK